MIGEVRACTTLSGATARSDRSRERRGPGLDPEAVERLSNRNQASPNDLKPRLPRVRPDLRPPQRPDQNQTRLRPSHAHTATEPKKPAAGHRGTRLLADLSPQGIGPVLARLGPAAGQAPAVTIATDQHDGVPGDTDPGRAMRRAWWGFGRRVPRHPPVLTVAGDHPGNTVLSDAHTPGCPPTDRTSTLPADHRRGHVGTGSTSRSCPRCPPPGPRRGGAAHASRPALAQRRREVSQHEGRHRAGQPA
jgi:hypothetical protein